MVYQTRLETEYAVPTASLAPRVQRGTMPGPPGAGFLPIIVFGISGPPCITLSPIARSVSRASTIRSRGCRIVNNCKYEMNEATGQTDGVVCLLSLQTRKALSKCLIGVEPSALLLRRTLCHWTRAPFLAHPIIIM